MYVLNTGFYRSTDAGKTFKAIRVPHGDNHDLWIAPNDPSRMINSNDGGANVSVNGGESWTAQGFPTAQFYNVFVTAHVPYHVCGSQQDNSTACVTSTGSGDELYAAGGGESGYIAPDPRNPDVFYAGSYGGYLTRYDRRANHMKAINVWPDNPMGYSAIDITERFQWTYPIVFSPADPNILYVGSQHVWRTTNGGQSWQRISPDLTRHDPATLGPSGGPITLDQTGVETYATVFTIAPARQDVNLIWAGSDDGYVHVTRDGGKNWDAVTPKDLPDFARISLIEASPHKAGTAFLAANRYQRNDRAPYVYRTDDFGKTWIAIVNGLPGDDFARTIREDIRKPGLLYLGTEHGVYVSFDNGANGRSLRRDLPVTPVHGLVSTEQDLVIGTHGRSFYILDNAAILRQFTPGVTGEPVHVFDPPTVMRGISRGVPVDFYLKDAADTVTIEVLDAQGKPVNSYTGNIDKGAPVPDVPRAEEDGFRPQAPRVPTKAGMNRFVWDMRRECQGLSGPDHVGRKHQRPAGASNLPGTADRRGRDQDGDVCDHPQSQRPGADRRQSAAAVCAGDADSRPGHAGESDRDPDSGSEEAGDRSGCGRQREDQRQEGVATGGFRRGAGDRADRYRRRDLPVPQPEQPGSVELPDQAEQQTGGAPGRGGGWRRCAHRAVLRRVQGAGRPTGSAAREARRCDSW